MATLFDIKSNGSAPLTEDAPELTEFIKPSDEAIAVVRPETIDEFYVEREHSEAETEQREAYAAKGVGESRPARTTADGLKHDADKATATSDDIHEQASVARRLYNQAQEVIGALVRRPTDSKTLKWLRWALILMGDVAGITGAALLLGEQPLNAFMQGLAGGAAAVTLGAVGRELRYLLAARTRQKDLGGLSEAEQPFAAFFAGPNTGEVIVKMLVLVCATGMVLIGGGIFALRSATEGLTAGVVFGCLALALGLASLINSFDTADDVAEFLDNKRADQARLEQLAKDARSEPVIKQRDEAEAEAESIVRANEKAGEAAAAGVRRHLQAVLGNSPGVAGNGTARASSNGKVRSNGHGPDQDA